MKSYYFTILLILASYGLSAQSFFSTVSGGPTADGPVELGMRFTTSANATINGLRFYKVNAGLQNYVLKLYSGNTFLTQASYSGSQTGWINVTIPATSLIPGVTYTVSYYSPAGFYQAANPYAWPVTNGPLTATGSVYLYKNVNNNILPVSTFQTSNYFADLVLQGSTPPVGGRDTIYIRDTVVLPCYPPDSSLIITNGSNIEKYFYFFDTVTNIVTIRDTISYTDTLVINDTIYRVDTVRIDNYLHDTIQLACIDTLHALYGWDAYDSTNYLPHYKDFKIVELPTFDGKKIRYVHKIVEAIRREEWDETTQQWIER